MTIVNGSTVSTVMRRVDPLSVPANAAHLPFHSLGVVPLISLMPKQRNGTLRTDKNLIRNN